ncbi:MAG TPA: DUF58 domain-containing protein, partial [Firmicutes bacterium]|nr:DUF58 domain-containing protein [Bacillota bacterium]
NNPLFSVAIVLLGVAALLAGGRFIYLFFYLIIFLFLIPWLWLHSSLKKLRGTIETASPYTEAGHHLVVTYRIENPEGGSFPYLELTDIIGPALQAPGREEVVFLEPGAAASFTRRVFCPRRGQYDLHTLKVKTGDPFGIFQLARPLAEGKSIKVYPRIRPLPGITPAARRHFGSLPVKEKYLENYSILADLRKWQPEDSTKKIHWKQSARQDYLVVKNFEHKGEAALSIFLDMSGGSYRHDRRHVLEDLAVEAATSLFSYCLNDDIPAEIFSEPLLPVRVGGRRPADFWVVVDKLLTLKPLGRTAFPIFVSSRSHYLPPSGTIYLITPKLDLEAGSIFLRLHYRGFRIILYYPTRSGPEAEEAAALKKIREAGIKVHLIYPTEADGNARRAL